LSVEVLMRAGEVPADLARFFEPVDVQRKSDVWQVATQPYSGAHFACFPPKLIEPCILAGSREGDTILDPFNGAGTTGLVALRHGRSYVGIELNAEYADMARWRLRDDAPLLNTNLEIAA
jgi:DNA modification methylase